MAARCRRSSVQRTPDVGAHRRATSPSGPRTHGNEGTPKSGKVADIQTTMIYVHHVPQHDAADRLGELVEASEDPLVQSVSPTVSRNEQISGDLTEPDTAS
jgi:hypothetical protein